MASVATPRVRFRPRVQDCDRKRAAKACWRCRNRKSRCIIVRSEQAGGACQRCLKSGVDCVFGEADINTSLSPREDEDARETESPGEPCWPSKKPVPSRYIDSCVVASTESAAHISNRSPLKRHSHNARLLVRNPHQTHYVGEVSNGTFLSDVQEAVVASSPDDVPREVSRDYLHLLDANSMDAEVIKTALDGFPPKNVCDFLVATFFRTVEANYYFMDREKFRERLDHCYAGAASGRGELDASFVCLALMVFAMGSQFADLRAPSKVVPCISVSKHGPGMVFYARAKILLSDVITQCSLESIQACFLIGLFLLPSNTSDLSDVYHGMALKMTISGGLHRKVADTDLDQRVLHVRNRLWWSLYTSERRLTIILDRPESIREEDIDAPLPEFCPELDLPSAGDNIANLKANIQLTRIFNRVVKLGKEVDFAEAAAEPRVAEIKHDLESWLRNLPPQLHVSNLNPEGKSFRGAVHLHMCYNQIIIYIGRTILLRRIQESLQPGRRPAPEPAAQTSPHSEVAEPSAAEVLSGNCVKAAYKIADLVRFLAETRKLARFSFTDMNCCSSAAIIIIIHEIVQRHPLYASYLASIMRSMRFMASGCQNAKHSLKIIQDLQVFVGAAISRRLSAQPQPPTGDTPLHQSTPAPAPALAPTEYEQWEEWIAEAENWSAAGGGGGGENPDGQSVSGRLQLSATPLGLTDPAGHPDDMLEEAEYVTAGDMFSSREAFAYSWPDELNSLGLSGFEGLEFPSV